MSDYRIVEESYYGDGAGAKARLTGRVKALLHEGYSLGGFDSNPSTSVLTQIMYKTALPQGAVIDNKLALGFMGPREGSMGPREGSKGGRRITNSSRPRRARRHSASRPRRATSTRRSRRQK